MSWGRVERQLFQAKAPNLTLVHNMWMIVDSGIKKGQNVSDQCVDSAAVLHCSLSPTFKELHHLALTTMYTL